MNDDASLFLAKNIIGNTILSIKGGAKSWQYSMTSLKYFLSREKKIKVPTRNKAMNTILLA